MYFDLTYCFQSENIEIAIVFLFSRIFGLTCYNVKKKFSVSNFNHFYPFFYCDSYYSSDFLLSLDEKYFNKGTWKLS